MNIRAADHAAQQHKGNEIDTVVQRCKNAPAGSGVWIHVIGEDMLGLSAISTVLSDGKGNEIRSKTAADGHCAFEGIATGQYQLSLPELDRDAWKVIGVETLEQVDSGSNRSASWVPARDFKPGKAFVHEIAKGECVSMIAQRYGFFPLTIWESEGNKSLRACRDSLYVLSLGDKITVPARRLHSVSVTANTRVIVKRLGVPERLRIRFLRYDDKPRADLPYLLSIETVSGAMTSLISAVTDAEGFVDCFIPPDAIVAEVAFGNEATREAYRFDLGQMPPCDSIAGWQSRLLNLGYFDGECDGIADARLYEAVAQFQRKKDMPVTGKLDENTKQFLYEIALS